MAATWIGVHPELRDVALEIVDAFERWTGVRPVLTSGYRSRAEQQALYDNRASNPYPVNKPGDSAHEYGLAFDSYVPEPYRPAWTALRQYVGLRVPDNDVVHAEVPEWRRFKR